VSPQALAGRSRGSAAFWSGAIACFLAACAILGASVAQRGADAWARTLDGAASVRVTAPAREGVAEEAAALLQSLPEVASARVLSRERAGALLGRNAQSLPSLRLVELELTRGGVGAAERIRAALAKAGIEAEVFGPSPWAIATAEAARRLAQLALAAAGLTGGAAALIVPLGARQRVRADRESIAVLLECGAGPGQGLGVFARRGAYEGLGAGLLGGAAATALAFGLVSGAAPGLAPEARWALLGPQVMLAMAGMASLAGVLAGAGARIAARRVWLEAEGRA
jgi:cell division protein FtsX